MLCNQPSPHKSTTKITSPIFPDSVSMFYFIISFRYIISINFHHWISIKWFNHVQSPCSSWFFHGSSMVSKWVSQHPTPQRAPLRSIHGRPRCPGEVQASVGMQRSQLQRLTNHATAEPAEGRLSAVDDNGGTSSLWFNGILWDFMVV